MTSKSLCLNIYRQYLKQRSNDSYLTLSLTSKLFTGLHLCFKCVKFKQHRAVAFYAKGVFLKTSHNSRLIFP
jgi:hypothetical protein